MPPFAFIENDHFTQAPTTTKKWLRAGPAAPDFDAADVLPALTRGAIRYIGQSASKPQPFFLYLSLTSPHTPILPAKEFQGRSGLNPYADFVMATDRTIGDVLDSLEKNHLAENTLVFLTSDNGCSPAAKVDELVAKGHFPSAQFRGYKADIFDGGHRIPLLARWPGHILPGSSTSRLTCLTDFIATTADLLDNKLPANAGEDSESFLTALSGKPSPSRSAVVHHSINGSFAIRDAGWKLSLCPDSGGWSNPMPGTGEARALPRFQLYDLSQDEAERANVISEHPEIAACMSEQLGRLVKNGRSSPGEPQANDVPVTPPEFKSLRK
jgi:arylsulfatase A-like enzyme